MKKSNIAEVVTFMIVLFVGIWFVCNLKNVCNKYIPYEDVKCNPTIEITHSYDCGLEITTVYDGI